MSERVSILVVDDDGLDREAVRRALRSSGLRANVTDTEDSASALAALQQSSFDCILLDYRLPGADGLEVLRRVRAAGVKTPIIVLTGQGDEQLAVEIMKAGATDYLAKGRISADALASSVRHALRVHRAEMQAAEAEAQRQHAEAALRQNERLLAITLKSIGDAVIATDAAGQVTFMNTVAETLTGWTAQFAVGQSFEVVLPLLDATELGRIESPPSQVLRSGTVIEVGNGVLAQSQDGHRFPIVSSSAPIRSDDGAIIGVVVVFRDMTERVRTEERLRFLAEMSQLLASSLDYRQHLSRLANLIVPRLADLCAIDVARSDGTIQRLAFAATDQVMASLDVDLAHYAIDSDDSFGPARVIATAQTEYYPELPQALLEQVKEDLRGVVSVARLTSWISVPLIVRDDTLGAITLGRAPANSHYTPDDVAFVEEVARRTALAVDNALLYREAQEAIHTRDAFLSIAAHELKTPLTSLLGYAELLQRRLKRNSQLAEREQRVFDVITDQARRLNKMIHALFDLSRLQTGQLSLECTQVDLAVLAARIVKEIEPSLDRHTLHIEIEGQPLMITGDELRLEQVIQNLIQNAIKYSPAGGPVFVRLQQQDEWVRLSVQDCGLGIPSESLSRIFRRFYRATNTESYNISGMGVGLYVAKQIIDLHGGRIEVESVEGQGSTFIVLLPVAAAATTVVDEALQGASKQHE